MARTTAGHAATHHGVQAGVGDLIEAVLGAGARQVFLCEVLSGCRQAGTSERELALVLG